MGSRLEFRVLGPLTVRVDGALVHAGGPKQRALLALLLLSANRVVARERLIGELFAEQSANSADHALHNHVSRLRKLLGPAAVGEPRLVGRPPGYLLRVEPGELDLERFERLAADGREALAAGDPSMAATLLRSAEELWTGRPLADLEFERLAQVEAEGLEELRLGAVESRVDAELALGRHLALVPQLEALVGEYPYRERFRAQLMLALYRCGRQAESLDFYRRTRKLLDDELGLEPAVELQQLERAILVQDPTLSLAAGADRASIHVSAETVCPFKGLAPFDAADARLFFGRERLIDELLPRLRETPLLLISGPSGIGKSSLVRAGLLPALSGARQVVIRPGAHPPAELARALGAELPQALARLQPGERLHLAVDQFEEVFSQSVSEDERRAFIEALVEAAWDSEQRAAILLALRADFWGRLVPYGGLADLAGANHVLLGPMTASELRRAIERPCEQAGLAVEAELVEALVDDAAGEVGGLPLLSTVLVDLYHDREDRLLTLGSYRRMGGVRGAVARHAEAAFSALDAESQQIARSIFSRLVTGGDEDLFARRRVERAELDAEDDDRVPRVLATLVERRLLVADDGTVELVHEALIEQWPRLAGWLEEDSEGRRLHRHLTRAASEWASSEKEPSELYRGTRLAATLEWADAEEWTSLNRLEREFLDESRAIATLEAERQRRANTRLRRILAAAIALLLGALAAGAVALDERGTARRQATAAIAQRLGAQALTEPQLDRALLLAREGVDLDDALATRSNLLATLLRSPPALAVLHGGGAQILDDALSHDGRTLAARSDNGSVTFFDRHTLRETGPRFPAGTGLNCGAILRPVRALAFSPDGETLAVGDSGGKLARLYLVDTRSHRTRAVVGSSNAVTADVMFAPRGGTLITGEAVSCAGGPPAEMIVTRSATDGRALRRSRPIAGGRLVGITNDGHSLLVTSGDQRSLLLDRSTLEPVRTFPISGGVAALAPNEDTAAFGQDNGSVFLLDLRTGRRRPMERRATGRVLAVAFSRDGKVLATTSDDGSVSIWDVPTASLRERFTGHAGSALGPLFSADGATLYTGSSDGLVIAWDVRGERRLGKPFRFDPIAAAGEGPHTPAQNPSTAVAVSPDNALFATSPRPGHVTLWRSSDQAVLDQLQGPFGYVVSLAFSHNGRLLAVTGNAPNTVVWNVATRRSLRILRSPVSAGAAGVAFSPDDDLLATSGVGTPTDPALLRIYALRTGRLIGQVRTRNNTLQDLDFSTDGRLLASGGLDGKILVWNVARRRLERTIAHHVAIFTLRFSPDSRTIATGDISGNVTFWDARTGRQTGHTLGGQNGYVSSVAYLANGRELVTTSGDGKLRLWDLASSRPVGSPLPGAGTGGWGTSFPDGKHAISVFYDGTGVVWNLNPAAWKADACRIAHRNLTRAEWHDFLPQRSYRSICR